MPDQRDQQEDQLKSRYNVRQVTNIQASWTERERGEEGRSTLQLSIEYGAEKYMPAPDADDTALIRKLCARSGTAPFDLERKVLRFSNLTVR